MYLAINFSNCVAAVSASEADAVEAVRRESRKMGDAAEDDDVRTTWVVRGSPFLVSRGDMQPAAATAAGTRRGARRRR